MPESFFAVCLGYVVGQAVCRKFLSHRVSDLLGFTITVFVITAFQIAVNFFSGADDIMSFEFLLLIFAGCGVGQFIVTILFKR